MEAVSSAIEIKENLARLEEQLGSEALQSLLGETVDYLRAARKGLQQSHDAGDWAGVRQQLHQLKGSLVIYGSGELQALLARAGASPVEERRELLDAIGTKLSEASSILQARIQELG